MTIPATSRRKSKYPPRRVPSADAGERIATSAMIASLDADDIIARDLLQRAGVGDVRVGTG